MERKQSFLGGAAILAAGTIVVKLIGALFKIPLYSILGEGGAADFYNAYSIYAAMLTISTTGLPVALSKMISEEHALGNERQVQRIFRVACGTFLVLGLLFGGIMLFGSDLLAGFLHNEKAALGIRVLAPAVICVGGMSAFRGYAQGHSNMVPTSISQIIEALCKLIFGLILAISLLELGKTDTEASAGAIAGVMIGTVLAVIFMTINYVKNRPQKPKDAMPGRDRSNKDILKKLFSLAIPITLSSSMVSVIVLIDTSIVQGRLQNALHFTLNETRVMYGTYSSGMNLYNLPSALITALTISVIPAISGALAKKDRKTAGKVVESSLRLTGLLVFPMGLGLWALGTPIMALLYPRYDSSLGGPLLSILGIASLFVCVMLVCNSILQAHGFIHLPVLTTLTGGLIELIVDYILVGIPSINIYGAPIGTIVCFGIPAILNLIVIRRVIPKKPNYARIFPKPLLASVIMGIAARLLFSLLHSFLGNTVSLALTIVAAVLLYAAEVVLFRILDRETVLLLPKGEKLARLLKL